MNMNYDNYIPKWDALPLLDRLTDSNFPFIKNRQGWDEISAIATDDGFIQTYVLHYCNLYAIMDTRWRTSEKPNILIEFYREKDDWMDKQPIESWVGKV